MKRNRSFVVFTLAVLLAGSAVGNGVDFFQDALQPGPRPLIYAGRITDASGKPISNARVYVEIPRLSITLEAYADSKGRYRTHDIRKALEMIGEQVKPSEIRISVKRSYYRQVAPTTENVPEQDEGTIVIDFIMDRS